jgi:alkylation response protein AidB-like acyl-CoA dehydrogenase
MASGEYLGAFALTEPTAGSDAASLKSKAVKTSGGYKLSGEKCYITSAGFADIYVLFARLEGAGGDKRGDGICAFVVESTNPGLKVSKPEKKMGCELSPIASLSYADMELSEENLLGSVTDGYSIALSGLSGGRINIAACANGLSHAALDIAIRHLKERKQFGQALIDFQGLQFMLADMKMKLEASLLLTWQAARTLEANSKDPSNRLYPSLAKCFATDSAMQIATDAVQLLGGAGYIKEYTVERLMRDAKMLQIVEGTNQVQRSVIAREMSKIL